MTKEISPEALRIKLVDASITAIDIREEWEYDEDNIGTTHISLYELPHRINELLKYKNTPLVVFCKTGVRGVQAQKFLTKQGFNQVYNLTGGIEAYLQHYN